MDTATQFKKRVVGLITWFALLILTLGMTAYFWADERIEQERKDKQDASLKAERERLQALEAQLMALQKSVGINAKLRTVLQQRIEDAKGQTLSGDDEKLLASIRELLAEPVGGDEQNAKLRAALGEAIAAAELREFRAANAEIEREVEAARGLKFITPVQYRTMKVAEFPEFVRKELRAQYTEREFHDYGRSLSFLGLLPDGYDIEKGMLTVMGEQVGAFFDPKTKHLVTFSDKAMSTGLDRMVMAHELTHALDDQHFTIPIAELERKDNDDRVRAWQALIEGNATMLMGQVYLQHAARVGVAASLKDIGAMFFKQDTKQFNEAPPFLQQSLIFPYMQGQQFVLELMMRGDGSLRVVDDAYRRPPASTEQVLHPEKYFAKEEPKEIQLPDLAKEKGWKLLSNNVVGEMGMQILVGPKAAAGWNGDRYAVWEIAPEKLGMIWVTYWGNADDAKEFEEGVLVWSKKYKRNVKLQRNDLLGTVNVLAASDDETLNLLNQINY